MENKDIFESIQEIVEESKMWYGQENVFFITSSIVKKPDGWAIYVLDEDGNASWERM